MLKYLINQIETKSKILLENLASRQTHLFVLIGLDQKVLMFGSDGVTVWKLTLGQAQTVKINFESELNQIF